MALAVGLLVTGFIKLRDMPRSVLPEFRPPTVEVQTEALGLSAEEVERLITVPLEQEVLNGVAFLDSIRSESVPGLSRIEMIFEPGTPTLKARQVVTERLTQASQFIPNVSKPPQMLQPISSEGRMMLVGLSSKTRSLIDMSVLAKWTIRPRLMGIPGVANVAVWGHREHQLQVQVDPARLRANGVTLDQVMRTTGNSMWFSPLSFLEASTPGTGGFFDTETQRIGVQHTQPIKTADDLAKVSIEGSRTGKRLGDVATVVEDHQPLIGDAVAPDGTNLLLVVEKFPEANTLDVTRNVEKALHEMAPGLSGIEVDTSLFQPANYISESGDNFRTALLIGFGLLALALVAFLRRLRTLVVALVAVVLSMGLAVLVLSVRGETLNLMILAGLALALVVIVDDAVVSADTMTRLGQADADESRRVTLGRYVGAILSTRGPLVYATAAALLALVPIVLLDGEAGAFLPPVAMSYACAILLSLVVSLTATPALATLLQSKRPLDGAESPLARRAGDRYEPALRRMLRAPRRARLIIGALLVLGFALIPFVHSASSLVPPLKDRDLLIQWNGAPGTSLAEMQRIGARASAELKSIGGVERVGGHVGRAITGDQIVGANSGVLWVSIKPSADYAKTARSVERVVDGYPGIDSSVLTYNKQRIDDVVNRPEGVEGKDLTVRVFGYDTEALRNVSDSVVKRISGVGGVEDVKVERPTVEPTLDVTVDLDAAEENGIKAGDIRRAAATLLSGVEVGNLFEQQKVFEVVVWGTPDARSSVEKVKQLLIDVPDGGGQVPLSDLADVSIRPSLPVIRHEDVSRYMDIGMNVRGIDVHKTANEIRDRLRAMSMPSEYHAEVLGGHEQNQSHRLQFLGLIAVAGVGIFLLLQAVFASWRLAGATLLALAAAVSGGIAGLVLDGGGVTIGSLAGLLAVFALAVRHAVLFVGRAHERELDEAPFDAESVVRVARVRLAPTVTAALAVVLAFVPFLVLGDRAGLEVVEPMAAVVIGGVVTTLLVDLFVVPVLYLRYGHRTVEAREEFDMRLDADEDDPLVPVPA